MPLQVWGWLAEREGGGGACSRRLGWKPTCRFPDFPPAASCPISHPAPTELFIPSFWGIQNMRQKQNRNQNGRGKERTNWKLKPQPFHTALPCPCRPQTHSRAMFLRPSPRPLLSPIIRLGTKQLSFNLEKNSL